VFIIVLIVGLTQSQKHFSDLASNV